jgi:ribosomal protein S7
MISKKSLRKFFQKNFSLRQKLSRSASFSKKRHFFKRIVQRSVVGSLTTNGKKSKANRIFYNTIRYLRFFFSLQKPLDFVFNSIAKFRPLFSVYLFRKGGTVHKVPSPITFKRSLLQVFGWFRRAVKSRKERFYHERFLGELVSLTRFTGETYKQYKLYHTNALQNRVLIRRALTPYKPLRIRRRRRRRNFKFKYIRKSRLLRLYGRRLKHRYMRRRYFGLFNVFRRLYYYLFFYNYKSSSRFGHFLQSKQLLTYLFFAHRRLSRYVLYQDGLSDLQRRYKKKMQDFFFTRKFRFSIASGLFGGSNFYKKLQVYKTNRLRFYFRTPKFRRLLLTDRQTNPIITKYNFFSNKNKLFNFSNFPARVRPKFKFFKPELSKSFSSKKKSARHRSKNRSNVFIKIQGSKPPQTIFSKKSEFRWDSKIKKTSKFVTPYYSFKRKPS